MERNLTSLPSIQTFIHYLSQPGKQRNAKKKKKIETQLIQEVPSVRQQGRPAANVIDSFYSHQVIHKP